jgi:hypothetical protein
MPNLIRDAIGILQSSGWMQGEYRHDDYGFCMLGAMAVAGLHAEGYSSEFDIPHEDVIQEVIDDAFMNPNGELGTALNVVLKTISDQHGHAVHEIHEIARFNDSEKTSFRDVIAILEKAAVAVDEIV